MGKGAAGSHPHKHKPNIVNIVSIVNIGFIQKKHTLYGALAMVAYSSSIVTSVIGILIFFFFLPDAASLCASRIEVAPLASCAAVFLARRVCRSETVRATKSDELSESSIFLSRVSMRIVRSSDFRQYRFYV